MLSKAETQHPAQRLQRRGCREKTGLKPAAVPGRVDYWKRKGPSLKGTHPKFRETRENPNHEAGDEALDEEVERDSRSSACCHLLIPA